MIQRYDIKKEKLDEYNNEYSYTIEKCAVGNYVKYDDHVVEVEKKVCEWVEVDLNSSYESGCCGEICTFYDLPLKDSHYNYCPYCGGKIKIKE
jgi:DNA-directed RNA polymerase subunit RPC12/RpoP